MSHVIQLAPFARDAGVADPIAPIARTDATTRRMLVLDVLYLAIGALGFLILWAIARACDQF